jgi:hypothetical protein
LTSHSNRKMPVIDDNWRSLPTTEAIISGWSDFAGVA